MAKADSASRTINRICDLLNSFSENEPVLSLTQISQRIDLPKSTTYRFLEALESQGMLYREPNGRGFRLGYQLIHWGTLSQASINLRNLALPVLHQLSEETGESAILSVRLGYAGIWIEMIESRHPVRLAMRVGQHLHLHAGASSKVLWAFLPPAQTEDILAHIELKPLCKNTITDPAVLRQELENIRACGYAVSFEETDPGAMGVAAPVFDHTGRPAAGIGIAAPVNRVPPERVDSISAYVLSASQQLSRLLGASPNLYKS